MRTIACLLSAALIAAAPPAGAQSIAPPAPSRTTRALLAESGVLVPPPARATATFGAGVELGRPDLPGALRLGLAAWVADGPRELTTRGAELSALWQLQPPTLLPGVRLLAGAGPALVSGGGPPRPAAAAAAGLRLALAAHDALGLDLRATMLASVRRQPQRSLRLGLRLASSGAALRAEEHGAFSDTILAQLVPPPPPPDLAAVIAAAGGLLEAAATPGTLRLRAQAFDAAAAALRRQAFRHMERAGGALLRAGADALWVVVYAGPLARTDDDLPSRRAVAIARALVRGGYPSARIHLAVSESAPPPNVAARIVAGSACLSGCAVSARLP